MSINKYTINVTVDNYSIKGITSLTAGVGMEFSEINSIGEINLGTPSTISSITPNQTSTTSHTHSLDDIIEGGTYDKIKEMVVDTKGRITSINNGAIYSADDRDEAIRRVLIPNYLQSYLPPEASSTISFVAGVKKSVSFPNAVYNVRGFAPHPTIPDTFTYVGNNTTMEFVSGSALTVTDDRAVLKFRLIRIRNSVETILHYTIARTITGVGDDPGNFTMPDKIIEVLNGDSFKLEVESSYTCNVTFLASVVAIKEVMTSL